MKTKIILTILIILIGFRLILPYIALKYINHALDDDLGVYQGHVNDLDISLYRGAYQLQDLIIKKADAAPKLPPLLKVKEIDLSVSWRSLFNGELAVDATLKQPNINLSDSGDEKKKQLGVEEENDNWLSAYETIIPIDIQDFTITDGKIQFVNNDLKTPIPVLLSKIELNIKNIKVEAKDNLSPITLKALAQEHADLNLDAIYNFISKEAQWDMNFKLEKFELKTINKNLRVYVPLDVTTAKVSFYGEATANQGNIDGYTKVFINDADIISTDQEFLNLKHFFYEIIIAFANWYLENDDTKNVAVKIPFKSRNGKFDIDTSDVFWDAVKNKDKELVPGIENSQELAK